MCNFLVLRLRLVRDAPDNHLVCRLAADRTGICDVLLLERHAAARHTGLFLDLLLAGEVAAPHGLDKAGVLSKDGLHLVKRLCGIGMRLAVCERLLIQRLLDILQQCRNGLFEILELNNGLFAGGKSGIWEADRETEL